MSELMLLIETLRSPRSTDPTYVKCKPESSANFSWVSPFTFRCFLRALPNLTWIEFFRSIL